MKIALITPSNILYMPYVGNYEKILNEFQIDYDIINWDRFGIEDKNNFLTYRDKKIGHQRNILDYLKYKQFIVKKLGLNNYDKIIIFGLQISFLLQRIITKKFKGSYIIDIRDYNRIINYFDVKKVIYRTDLIALSSEGFKKWLPEYDNYIINHNTQIKNLDEIKSLSNRGNKNKIKVANIGIIRDYRININFINSVKNSKLIEVYYHGEGSSNKDIQNYIKLNKIMNVHLTGRYEKEDEYKLYENCDLVNILMPNDSIINRTALQNRLYNAVIFGKPILAFNGTYLSEIVNKYQLGIVFNSFENVEDKIYKYLSNLDFEEYNKGRYEFIKYVINENKIFEKQIKKFINVT